MIKLFFLQSSLVFLFVITFNLSAMDYSSDDDWGNGSNGLALIMQLSNADTAENIDELERRSKKACIESDDEFLEAAFSDDDRELVEERKTAGNLTQEQLNQFLIKAIEQKDIDKIIFARHAGADAFFGWQKALIMNDNGEILAALDAQKFLEKSLEEDNRENIKIAQSYGSDLNIKKNNPLIAAVQQEDIQKIIFLTSLETDALTFRDENNVSAFEVATNKSRKTQIALQVHKNFLSNAVSADTVNMQDIQVALELGSDINNDYYNPLSSAVCQLCLDLKSNIDSTERVKVIEFLVNKGANPYIKPIKHHMRCGYFCLSAWQVWEKAWKDLKQDDSKSKEILFEVSRILPRHSSPTL